MDSEDCFDNKKQLIFSILNNFPEAAWITDLEGRVFFQIKLQQILPDIAPRNWKIFHFLKYYLPIAEITLTAFLKN